MLLEREKSLQQLDDLANAAEDRRGSIALVAGEAGIGKTTLLEEMRHRISHSCDVFWGGCEALATPRPLGPIHDMAPALGSRIEALLAESSQPTELFDAILHRIERSDKTAVLVFEDVHWADHATLDFLKFIGRRASMLRMLLILSFRSDEIVNDHPFAQILADLPDAYTHQIEIEPLSAKGVKTLGASSGYKDEELFEITGGNPFFVTELLAWRDSARGSVPASVKDAVASRLNRLAPAERDFLETISVIPGSVSPGILEPLFGDNGETLAMACVGRSFLMRGVNGSLRFRHELARLATLARLSGIQKKDRHARVLAAMQKNEVEHSFDRLVHHAAGAMDGKRVLEFAPAAAAKAAAVGAHREAAAHLGTAIRFINEAEPGIAATLYEDWAYEAGLALQISDEVIEARRHAVTLWRALGRIDKVGNNLRWLSRLHWYRGEAAEATHFADEAVRVLESTEPSEERAMAYSLRSQLHMLNNRMEEAVEWGQRALKLAEEFDNAEVKIHSLNNIGTALIFRGNAEGIKQMNESLELALESGFHEHAARVYTNLSENAVDFKNFDLAERIISEGIAFDTHHDLDSWTHYLVGRLAQLRMDQGRLRDAETIADGVLKLEKPTLLMQLPALIVLARVRTRFGSPDAHELASQALQNSMATDEVQYIIPARLTLIEAAWLNDTPDKAAEHFDSLLRINKAELHRWNTADMVIWATRLNFEMPRSFASDLPPPHAAEFEGDFSKAAKTWQKLSVPYAAALAQLQSRDAADEVAIARAIKALDKMEASAAVAKARKIAAKLGIASKMPRARRGPYKSARNHPLGLTKREQDILKLVANGASNRDISARLKRSPRTIEHHVSSVLAKLNVANRMEAMLRVQNEPWLLPD
ncbi:MAG: AAA family ATPase, partial [Woeseiaceae bacterium]|nr:AAA family ATPase [Woeseiaceae bacterium]